MVERTFIDGKVIRVHSEGLGRKLAFTTASLEYAPLHGADSARRLGLKGLLFFRLEQSLCLVVFLACRFVSTIVALSSKVSHSSF